MGITAGKGSFGIGLQEEKGTPATSFAYIPALNVGLQPEQRAQSLPPEVGGGVWSLGSYKTGVIVAGDATFNARANSIGWLLRAFAGTATSVPDDGDEASDWGGVAEEGLYRHMITPVPTDESSIPWCTITKNISDVWTERYTDVRVDTLRLDVPAQGLMTVAASFVGCEPDTVACPTETYDTSTTLTTTTGYVQIGGSRSKKVTRFSIDFSNGLSRDEAIVGSYYLDDITVMSRTCTLSVDTFLTTADWYNQVYNNGGSTWDPTIYSAELDLEISGGVAQSGGTKKAKMRLFVPQVDYLTFPIAMAGGDLIRVTMTASLSLDGSNPAFYIELLNNQEEYALS
jgi:hypothetical protein